jgi:hypothetical protein
MGAHLQGIENPLWRFPLKVAIVSDSESSSRMVNSLCRICISSRGARIRMTCPPVDYECDARVRINPHDPIVIVIIITLGPRIR